MDIISAIIIIIIITIFIIIIIEVKAKIIKICLRGYFGQTLRFKDYISACSTTGSDGL